jgi:DNA polymerase III delta prime subunit
MELDTFTWVNDTIIFIEDWLAKIKNKSMDGMKKSVFLYGPPGIGKTTLSRIILEKHNFNIVELNASNHRNMSHIDKILKEINSKTTVHKLVDNKNKRNAIIMDEVDGLSIGEKSGLTQLLKYLKSKQNMYIPIICISNEKIDKKLKELKKFSHTFFIEKPTEGQMIDIAITIADQKGIQYTRPGLLELVKKSNGDIRILRNLLDLVKIDFNDEVINKGVAHVLVSRISSQHYFKSTTDFIVDTIGSGKSREEIMGDLEKHQFSLTEKSMISMMLHENLPRILKCHRGMEEPERIEKYMEFLELFSNLDYWNSQIFNKQKWEHGNLIEECTIIPILTELAKTEYKKPAPSSIKFTKILGKHSTIYSVLKSSFKFGNLLNVNPSYWLEKLPFLCTALLDEKERGEAIAGVADEEDMGGEVAEDNQEVKYELLEYLVERGIKHTDIQRMFKYNYIDGDDQGYCSFANQYIKRRASVNNKNIENISII